MNIFEGTSETWLLLISVIPFSANGPEADGQEIMVQESFASEKTCLETYKLIHMNYTEKFLEHMQGSNLLQSGCLNITEFTNTD